MAPPTQYPGHFDVTSLLTVICATLASYNALELILLIFTTFNAYHGLYFWSMVTATGSIIPYVIGMIIMFFHPQFKLAALIVNNIGWILMVVAQSVVLYSRLGFVLGNAHSRILVFTKWMIIIDAFIFYTLATTIVFGMHYSGLPSFAEGYIYVERLQMTGFCIQEFIISGLYILKTLDILQAGEKKQARRTLWQLFAINVVIVALDVALLVLEYLSLASIQIAFKALAYSVKLKMEFAILGKLVESSSLTQQTLSVSLSNAMSLDDRNPSFGVISNPFSPKFNTSALATWHEKKTTSSLDQSEHQRHESFGTISYQPDTSEARLVNTSSTTARPFASSRKGSDAYHDMIKMMTWDEA
ncbi:hypothetical protein LTS08_006939 [Lithohypha guttulata]|uniref:uncharacterized protein n=1 Tax=Lithohypha guttulata TaxID=1690604 RepID=UPI002DDDEBA7|nr:hypothetical protein LTR51_001990 [Lithohypha guttulata]KAK5097525.1 hypothetical protein LTS08_006939 [Lithohypha guttulata]